MTTKFSSVLLVLSVSVAWGQAPVEKDDPPAKWTILFRSDDPSLWDKDSKNAKGEQVAVPLKFAPVNFRYLRLRRMDTGEALILPIAPDQLKNGKPGLSETNYFWNGTAKEEWDGRHLGIAHRPRYRFPAPHNMISVMNEGWDAFAGSGFGHKVGANDRQYYSWLGKEIRRTVFEIGVSDGPLSRAEAFTVVPLR